MKPQSTQRIAEQIPLMHIPLAGLEQIEVDEANALLVEWEHRLGPCNRPFRQEAFGLRLDGSLIAVAISASIVSATAGGWRRGEVVELARLGRASEADWVLRVMLRLWREVCAPRWACWPVRAALSYHKEAWHTGDIYRFDGWKKVREGCGSNGGGAWSRKKYAGEAAHGAKSLWVWEYGSLLGEESATEGR